MHGSCEMCVQDDTIAAKKVKHIWYHVHEEDVLNLALAEGPTMKKSIKIYFNFVSLGVS